MDNNLKRLMSEEDLHRLKKMSIDLQTYLNTILKPLKDTFANEARRAINYNRKLDLAIRDGEKIIKEVKELIGDRT